MKKREGMIKERKKMKISESKNRTEWIKKKREMEYNKRKRKTLVMESAIILKTIVALQKEQHR